MNFCIKLVNSAVNGRPIEIAEILDLNPPLSFGFHKNFSTQSCVNYTVNKVRDIQLNEGHPIVIFLDISQAFDSVNLQKLIVNLQNLTSQANSYLNSTPTFANEYWS